MFERSRERRVYFFDIDELTIRKQQPTTVLINLFTMQEMRSMLPEGRRCVFAKIVVHRVCSVEVR